MRTNIPAEEEIIFLEVVPDILFHRSLHLTKLRGRCHLVGTQSGARGRSSGPHPSEDNDLASTQGFSLEHL